MWGVVVGGWVAGGQVHEDTRTALRKAKDSIQRVSQLPSLSHTLQGSGADDDGAAGGWCCGVEQLKGEIEALKGRLDQKVGG